MIQRRGKLLPGQRDEGLGPNTEIGSRLRALYGSVQDEVVPDRLLDLLEKLDSAEAVQRPVHRATDQE